MKITLKNRINIVVCTNVSSNNKEVLKYTDSNSWLSSKYRMDVSPIEQGYLLSLSKLGLGGSTDVFPPSLNIVNGVKMDAAWETENGGSSYQVKTSNEILINIIKNHGDLYIYGVYDN